MYDDLGYSARRTNRSKMANLASVPLRAQPGSEFNYSMGTDVLGVRTDLRYVIRCLYGKKYFYTIGNE